MPASAPPRHCLQTALLTNTLVCLPTGLGKTLIAAVVMHNFCRWFPEVGGWVDGGHAVLGWAVLRYLTTPICTVEGLTASAGLPACHCLPLPACLQGKVVFVAPTKPLVAQQVEACHSFMGMSKEGFCELTGVLACRAHGRRRPLACCVLCRRTCLQHAYACKSPSPIACPIACSLACLPACPRREQQARGPQGDVAGWHQALLLLHPSDLLERCAAR